MHGALGLLISAVMGADGGPPPTPPPIPLPAAIGDANVAKPAGREVWGLSLPEAIRIGLDNSESVRVISGCGPFQILCEGQPPILKDVPAQLAGDGTTPLIIGRLNADVNPWRFKSEAMALIRSIEQGYWSLVQHQEQLNASEQAVVLAEEIVKREQSELDLTRGPVADIAEAQPRLKQFRLDRANKVADVGTAERQLRFLLGLPPADQRQIVPVSVAVEDRRVPAWPDCLATMQERQPDIVLQREAVRAAEGRALIAIGRELIARAFGSPASRLDAAEEVRQALDTVRRQRAFLAQVVHQTTHSLARFLHELDANYAQFQAATQLRTAAAKRLEARRTSYEEGRITLDRYLDAVSQYASAVAQEALCKTSYNNSLVALEEARGTLLSARDIAVAVGPRPNLRRVAVVPN